MLKKITLFLLCGIPCMLYAQSRTISGIVTDAETKEALIGVTVQLEGSQTATVSDIDGKYVLTLPDANGSLVFSYIGYSSQSFPVASLLSELNVALASRQQLLDEVVVVGYGTEIKSQLTGSIAQVAGEDVALTPVMTVEQALQGKAAGVFIEANNGKVGAAMRIRVRGSSSINADNQPLFVVDGVPINTTAVNDGTYVYLNPLNDIDFNDIESIDILKDASAAAIYGSRGANGVIIITTKKGKKGEAKITVDAQYGYSMPTGLRDFMDAKQYVDYYLQAAENAGVYDFTNGISGYATEQDAIDSYINLVEKKLNKLSGGTDWENTAVNTDWQKYAFQTAISKSVDFSASGGSDKFLYFTSIGYSFQDGIMLGNHGDRLNGTFNLEAQLTEKFKIGETLVLSRSINNDIPDDDSFSTPLQIVAEPGIVPLRDSITGEYTDLPTALYANPLLDYQYTIGEITTYRTIGNLYAEYAITPHLTLRGEAGGDITNLTQFYYTSSQSSIGISSGGLGESYNARVQDFNSKIFLNYNQTINSIHKLNITTGTEYQKYDDFTTIVEGTGFPNDKLQTLASASLIVTGSSAIDHYRFLSYFARANYSLKEKYLFSLTGRFDGSSRFGQNNQYGFFPSASAGWLLSNEDFLSDNSVISYLKLRASYGITGNAEIGNFNYLGLYGIGSYGGSSSLYPSTIANPDLTWEKTAQTDIGIDFGVYNDRINGELDYYVKNTTDLLLDVPVPSTTGYSVQTQNIGKLNNKGIEFVLNADVFVNTFKWNTSLNFASNRNEVTELANGQTIIDYGASDFMNVVMVGQPIGVFYGAEYAGVDPDNGDALWYVNGEGTGEETTNDFALANYVIIGDPNPDFIAGLTNSFSYKGIELTLDLQSVYGNEVNLQGDIWMASNAAQYDNQLASQLDAWQNPGDQTEVPENRLLFNNGSQPRSSRYLSDGSYLRLKNVTLGYSFPKSITSRAKMSSLRVYASAYNLFTFTNYEGWDPEVSSDTFTDNIYFGIDFYSAPQPKTIVMGISIGL